MPEPITTYYKISSSTVLYLDDEPYHLQRVTKVFEDKNCRIKTVQSVNEALEILTNERIDIFLCDSKLKEIGNISGLDVLKRAQTLSSNTFFVLFTAFIADLRNEDLDWLNLNSVKVLKKNTKRTIISRLQELYEEYSKSPEGSTRSSLFSRWGPLISTYKSHVINHLKGISNQQIELFHTGSRSIKVADMASEIINDTVFGRQYMQHWLNVLAFSEQQTDESTDTES